MIDNPSGGEIVNYDYYMIGWNRVVKGEYSNYAYDFHRHSVDLIDPTDSIDFSGAKGLIIKQGIYESIHKAGGIVYGSKSIIYIECDPNHILRDKNQLFNLVRNGGWVCFLTEVMANNLSQYGGDDKSITDTDLAKVVLNELKISWRAIDAKTNIASSYGEFNNYLSKYGIAQTRFDLHQCDRPTRVISNPGAVVAFEVEGAIFFLPFLPTGLAPRDAVELVDDIIDSIETYRKDHIYEIPEWVDEFRFLCEDDLDGVISKLEFQLADKRKELNEIRQYKSILSCKGDPLRDKVADILQNYFGLRVQTIEQFNEDIRLISDSGCPEGVIEVKGTTKGVTREHINQVDTHREKIGLSVSAPAILIINSALAKDSLSDKIASPLAQEQIEHAVRNKVLIIRTVDLLFLMKNLEKKSISERRQTILKYFKSSYGWLKVDNSGIKLIDKPGNPPY